MGLRQDREEDGCTKVLIYAGHTQWQEAISCEPCIEENWLRRLGEADKGQISAFATLENLSQLAVGFANGAVTVIRGDLIHDRGAKQRTVFESEEPITGVEFREGPNTTLYLATTGRILTLTITGKGQGQPAKVLEDTGCGVGCMTSDDANGDIVVVRDDAIHYYGVNGRGPSFAYEGPKQLVRIFGNYVALVTPPKASTPTKMNALRRFVGSQRDDLHNTSTFALLDTDLKYIAHTETLVSQVKDMFIEWGDIFLLTLDGKVSDTQWSLERSR